jgi:LmbE family N-acetylglucosaminyl deacetylase
MTTGNKGSRQEHVTEEELANIRKQEDQNALETLGLKAENNINLDLGDGRIENSLNTIENLVRQIRQFKPDILVTHNPEQKLIRYPDGSYYINHRDHINTALSIIDAAYPYSRDILFFPNQIKEGLESHTVTQFLFVDSWGHQDTIFIDITNQTQKKIEALECHKSQCTKDEAQKWLDSFSKEENGKRYEQFRYVVAD